MAHRNLQIEQLDRRMSRLEEAARDAEFAMGWVRAVRGALGMSLEQLARKMGVTRQSMMALEKREREGTIRLNTLRSVGQALGLRLVYGFVPVEDDNLSGYVDRKARDLATEIVQRTLQTMSLEDQAPSAERIRRAIDERAGEIRRELPKTLWD